MAGSVTSISAPLDGTDPTRLGPYTLLGRLGDGGMGTVYLARRDGEERLVALKVIRGDLARQPEFRARFVREARMAQRVARFCTAEVLDVNADGHWPYLVTEYIEGQTLAEAIRERGPLPVAELERLAVAVASALSAIHAAGVVHRDLKPGNIVLSPSGARVIDFGIAHALDATAALTHTSLGTPAFMAPEQALGQPVTAGTDIYAWGGVILYSGTGRLPHGGGATPAILYRAVHEEPDFTGLDEGLRPLVEQTMAKDPASRPSAQDLLLRLVGRPRSADAVASPLGSASAPPPPEPGGNAVDASTQKLTDGTRDIADASNVRSTTDGEQVLLTSAIATSPPAPTVPPVLPSSEDALLTLVAHQIGETTTGAASDTASELTGKGQGTGTWFRRHRPRRSRLALALALLLTLVLLAAAAAGGAVVLLTGRGTPAAAAGVTTEPVGSTGTNPFMPPIGSDQRRVTPPKGAGGTFSGSTPGLYGGTRNKAACDQGAMVAFLQAHPGQAAAWAATLGISVMSIADYVAGLTPVILRSDTAVTNHGYRNGHATAFQSVLQAGTAVLVDKYGVPVSRCFCGNPLTPAQREFSSSQHYIGTGWTGFSPGAVSTIEKSDTMIDTFILVDPATNDVIARPRASDGSQDRGVDPATSPIAPSASTAPPATVPVGPTTAAAHALPPTSPAVATPATPLAARQSSSTNPPAATTPPAQATIQQTTPAAQPNVSVAVLSCPSAHCNYIQIESTGSAPLVVTGIEGRGTVSVRDPSPCTRQIAPGESCQVVVSHTPDSANAVVIYHNAPGRTTTVDLYNG
ncbi:serine/threonine-protein kinase [Pseudofrankia sp. BMG5.36]|uniref:serine/threonine-protein kinase n=1 Tax=Pseudofrankia sp. BMG5.36 TaxID=1834512 RepID=UPI0008D91D6E|nr:serine/threonine-protein kinase [Pseudofrankia sp. BMG5.36]OHV48898.1 hypothetical protein BCD48_13645 [Pseudofrankia sp. BMG5.36]